MENRIDPIGRQMDLVTPAGVTLNELHTEPVEAQLVGVVRAELARVTGLPETDDQIASAPIETRRRLSSANLLIEAHYPTKGIGLVELSQGPLDGETLEADSHARELLIAAPGINGSPAAVFTYHQRYVNPSTHRWIYESDSDTVWS